ncbi:MAG: hypothetical protein AAGJ87_14895, partial [Pseudomonadota bacterium]
ALVKEQTKAEPRAERWFPYHPQSVSTSFRRACRNFGLERLWFDALLHEATSRLFKSGVEIHEVAPLASHRDWNKYDEKISAASRFAFRFLFINISVCLHQRRFGDIDSE